MVKMLVIGTAVDAKDTAEDIDVMLKPQGMNSIQSLFECGVNMAIAFFNIKFSSSRMALRFCNSLICLAVITVSSSILISMLFLKLSSYFLGEVDIQIPPCRGCKK